MPGTPINPRCKVTYSSDQRQRAGQLQASDRSRKAGRHGEKFSVVDKKGEYKYLCTPHPSMEGIVRLK